jgi:LPS sulfotransferase NodH
MTDARLDPDDDETVVVFETGIDPVALADEDLFRELASLHRTRLDTLRHGPDAALANHFKRTAELETEYVARYPGREVDPDRLTQDF